MATQRFTVIKEFDWQGVSYARGDVVDIEEGHPRLPMMVLPEHGCTGHHLVPNTSIPHEEEPRGELVGSTQAAGRNNRQRKR